MTLAEKIAALRGERQLSQGDLAEKLDISRQSVSKWETGQSVPELDKLIKLADLFGVTVDQLVRDGDPPALEPARTQPSPEARPETKIVYVERRFTTVQTLGIILVIAGLTMLMCAAFAGADPMAFIGGALAIAGTPLLLVKKHPLLITGWVIWAGAYLMLCNPALTGAFWQPFWGIWAWCPLLGEDYMPPVVWLMWLAYIGESVLTILLPVCTARLCWRRRRVRKEG